MTFEYDEETENVDYEENLEEQVDNDEIDSSEAAFMQGYEDDVDDSFSDDKEEKEDEDEDEKKEKEKK